MKAKWIIVIAIVIPIVAASSTVSILKLRKESVGYRTAVIERGDIVSTVMASGTLHPLLTVQVGSAVSGTIETLYAGANSEVRQGQLIAKIDPDPFISKVNEAKANLKMAKAKVTTALAEVAKAEVQLKDAKRTYTRFESLVKDGVVTEEERDLTLTKYETAQSELDAARARYKLALAESEQAKASLETAELNLSHTDIFSPVDGTVLTREVDVGQTVAAQFQTPVLFTIAHNLKEMEAHLDVNEADVGRIALGQPATFYVNAYPDLSFEAEVVGIRSAPKVTQNVVTYDVVIGVENKELKLKPGMTANATIVAAEAKDVIKIPNAALRFKPSLPEKDNQRRPESTPMQDTGKEAEQTVVHVLIGKGKIKAVPVEIGITDDNFTELVKGDLKEGNLVAVGVASGPDRFKMPRRLF